MNYLILTTTIIAVLLLIYFLRKKIIQHQSQERPPWEPLMNDFKKSSMQIQSVIQLEEYLLSINEKVKQFETDYNFLVAFNGQIRLIRQRLKQKD